MRLSKRFFRVMRAKSALMMQLDTLQETYELTDIEMMQALNEWQASRLKYMLRVERNGDAQLEADIDHTGLEE